MKTIQMKSGPLSETAPILYDISFLPTWKKINSGLLKMFKVHSLLTCARIVY
jgi:serine/threonine-protein phosphatase 2A activator